MKKESLKLVKTGFCTKDLKVNLNTKGGESKPPLSDTQIVQNNACIDCLKVRFNRVFDMTDNFFKNILASLKVKVDNFDEHSPVSGYAKTLVYDANVYISFGGSFTSLDDGTETTMLEMKGQACREFETRGGDWITLLKSLLDAGGLCWEIDLAIDDFNNIISIPCILDHLAKKTFVSPFRQGPKKIESNGWSITFGEKSNRCLCIYDKKSEREHRNYSVMIENWVRFESRFMKENAIPVMKEVLIALQENTFGNYCKGVLRGMLDLKENNHFDTNVARVPTDKKWLALTGDANKIVVRSQARVETISRKKMKWSFRSTISVQLEKELCLLNTSEEELFDGYSKYSHLEKVNNQMIARVNYFRNSWGFPSIKLEDAKRYLFDKYSKYASCDDFIWNILFVDKYLNNGKPKNFEKINLSTGEISNIEKEVK